MTNDSSFEQQVADALAGKNPNAAATVNPAVPPHIASNLLEFLRRVESKGMEAVAWVEAYQFVQRHAPNQTPPVSVPPPK